MKTVSRASLRGVLALTALAMWCGCETSGQGDACPIASQTRCESSCVDLQSDNGHCGACDMQCGIGSQCVAGECEATCGNNHLDGDEVCDDGNTVNGDGCSADCQTSGGLIGCGNGTRTGVEECDDGNLHDGDGCSRFCRTETCGNAILDGNEACDVGQTANACCGACGVAVDCTCTSSPNLNTGSDPTTGGVLAIGSADLIWTWTDPSTAEHGDAIVSDNCAPGFWVDAPTDARWLTRYGCGQSTPGDVDTYYTATFTIPNATVAAGTVIAGTIWADNLVTRVEVNGVDTGVVGSDPGFTGDGISFGDWSSSLYVAGRNTITVVVHNATASGGLNPDGLLVSIPGAFTGSVCVPNP